MRRLILISCFALLAGCAQVDADVRVTKWLGIDVAVQPLVNDKMLAVGEFAAKEEMEKIVVQYTKDFDSVKEVTDGDLRGVRAEKSFPKFAVIALMLGVGQGESTQSLEDYGVKITEENHFFSKKLTATIDMRNGLLKDVTVLPGYDALAKYAEVFVQVQLPIALSDSNATKYS
ncbi:MAG: hypothetical protein ACRCWQ_10440, partial [Bacilli bacterium]